MKSKDTQFHWSVTQSHDPISCKRKPAEQTSEIKGHTISLVSHLLPRSNQTSEIKGHTISLVSHLLPRSNQLLMETSGGDQ